MSELLNEIEAAIVAAYEMTPEEVELFNAAFSGDAERIKLAAEAIK